VAEQVASIVESEITKLISRDATGSGTCHFSSWILEKSYLAMHASNEAQYA
jgi:hypothetical protein